MKREQISELAVSMVRQVCADHAKEALSTLEESRSAEAVNKGILRGMVRNILMDARLTPWLEEQELAIIERLIPTKLHVFPYFDCHSASKKRRHGRQTENDPMPITSLMSHLSIADPDLFLDPMEFLFEEYEGELVSEDNIEARTMPSSWDRKDALILPHTAVTQLLNWEKLDITALFSTWVRDSRHLFYAFRAYSPSFEDPTYRMFAANCLMHLGEQLRFNKSLGINTQSIFAVPVYAGPQSISSFCFTRVHLINA